MAKIIGRHTSGSAAGTIIPCGNASALPGTLLCDGSAVSRTTYADLFAAIGTTYGSGDGINTFNLPDTRGIFLRGAGTNPGDTNNATTLGNRQGDLFRSHAHASGEWYGNGENGSGIGYMGVNYNRNTAFTGGNETRPANVGVNYCIAF
jgi:hypothetical protein